jgi:hypothetical protein
MRSRARFRFSLAALLAVFTLVCCGLGWGTHVVRERRALLEELKVKGPYQFQTAAEWRQLFPGGNPVDQEATVPIWRAALGDEAVQTVYYYRWMEGFAESDLARVESAFPEAQIHESHPPPCHPGCFPHGTLVQTPRGPRGIETIRVGDEVVTFTADGSPAVATVDSVFVTTNRLWEVRTPRGVLLTTETQPLWLADNRTAPVGKLAPPMRLICAAGVERTAAPITSVRNTGRIEQVVNLVLRDADTFSVDGYLARSKPPLLEPDVESPPAVANRHEP